MAAVTVSLQLFHYSPSMEELQDFFVCLQDDIIATVRPSVLQLLMKDQLKFINHTITELRYVVEVR